MNLRRVGLQAVDAAAYAVALAAALFVAMGAVSVLLDLVDFAPGGRLATLKALLFFVGFGLFGYSTLRLRPPKPGGDEDGDSRLADGNPLANYGERTRFQRLGDALVPERLSLPPEQRLPAAAKLFLGSIAVLLTSMAMEYVFMVEGFAN